jgi:hypothetical protein
MTFLSGARKHSDRFHFCFGDDFPQPHGDSSPGGGNAEVGLKVGDRMWGPRSSMKQEAKSSKSHLVNTMTVLATLTFLSTPDVAVQSPRC